MHELWYDYIKVKYGKKVKLCYMAEMLFPCIHKNR